ncbi:MAG TPA: helix-turn-helix transcriptional regulator [Micromonosporaceae bacterium]|nr:helix-turn-helix transcriptional regulator [Micromonosporaceae bacterium]
MPETPHGPAVESIGALLARARTARGMSQLRLAELLCAASGVATVTRHECSRWEREERIPTGHWLRWLALVLEVPLEELEAGAAAARRRRAPEPRRHEAPLWAPLTADTVAAELDRAAADDLPHLAHAWLAEVLSGTPTAHPLPAPGRRLPAAGDQRAPAPPRPGPGAPAAEAGTGAAGGVPAGGASLDLAAARLAELRRMDDLFGGLALADLVNRELRAGLALLRPPRPAGRHRRALRLVAGFAQLAGWVLADSGRASAAARAYRAGLRTAVAAGDRALAAHLLGSASHLLAGAGEPRQALLLAQTAYAGTRRTVTAALQTLLLHRIAFAAAVAGERRVSERALAAAERTADRREPGRDPSWLYWLDDAELTAMSGRCFAALGRPLRAEPLLRPRLAARLGPVPPVPPLPPRTAAIDGGWLAQAYLDAGEAAQACTTAAEALVAAVRAGSARAAARALAAGTRLARLRDVPPAQEYADLLALARPLLPVAGAGQPGHQYTG